MPVKTLDQSHIARQFKKNHTQYLNEARVQKKMALHLLELLKGQKHPTSSLFEFGAGPGLLTELLAKDFPDCRYYLNDLVPEYATILAKILPRATFLPGDIATLSWPLNLDLIISNATIQWISDLPAFFKKASLHLKEKGLLILSSFGPQNYQEIKKLTGLGLAYFSLAQLETMLSPHFNILSLKEETLTLYFESPLAAFRHMQATGVNSLGPSHQPLWLPPLLLEYEKLRTEKGIPLTYHPQYILAERK